MKTVWTRLPKSVRQTLQVSGGGVVALCLTVGSAVAATPPGEAPEGCDWISSGNQLGLIAEGADPGVAVEGYGAWSDADGGHHQNMPRLLQEWITNAEQGTCMATGTPSTSNLQPESRQTTVSSQSGMTLQQRYDAAIQLGDLTGPNKPDLLVVQTQSGIQHFLIRSGSNHGAEVSAYFDGAVVVDYQVVPIQENSLVGFVAQMRLQYH